MQQQIRSMRRSLHLAESQPSASGFRIGKLERVPEQDPDRVQSDASAPERQGQDKSPGGLHAWVIRRYDYPCWCFAMPC